MCIWQFGFRVEPILVTASAPVKNVTRFKSGQKRFENNHMALLVTCETIYAPQKKMKKTYAEIVSVNVLLTQTQFISMIKHCLKFFQDFFSRKKNNLSCFRVFFSLKNLILQNVKRNSVYFSLFQ